MSLSQAKVISFDQTGRQAASGTRRRYRFKLKPGRVILIAVLIYAVFLFANQELHLARMRADVRRLQTEINQIQQANEGLRQEAQRLNEDAYIEKVAREELGLTKSNEVPYIPAQAK